MIRTTTVKDWQARFSFFSRIFETPTGQSFVSSSFRLGSSTHFSGFLNKGIWIPYHLHLSDGFNTWHDGCCGRGPWFTPVPERWIEKHSRTPYSALPCSPLTCPDRFRPIFFRIRDAYNPFLFFHSIAVACYRQNPIQSFEKSCESQVCKRFVPSLLATWMALVFSS